MPTERSIELVDEMILSQEDQAGTDSTPEEVARELNVDHVSYNWSWSWSSCPEETEGAKTYWFNYWKAHDYIRKLLSKDTWKRLQIAFFSDRIIFKVKQPYNSHKHVIYVPKKSATRKIILRNWKLSQADHDFCVNIKSW